MCLLYHLGRCLFEVRFSEACPAWKKVITLINESCLMNHEGRVNVSDYAAAFEDKDALDEGCDFKNSSFLTLSVRGFGLFSF